MKLGMKIVETNEGKIEEEFQLIFHLQDFTCK